MIDYETNIVKLLQEWLGENGLTYFREIQSKHGSVNAVWIEGKIPHATHFREGMQVRNKLREIIPGMNDHWYDNNWERLIETAITVAPTKIKIGGRTQC